jgi:hypothetical protein
MNYDVGMGSGTVTDIPGVIKLVEELNIYLVVGFHIQI